VLASPRSNARVPLIGLGAALLGAGLLLSLLGAAPQDRMQM
jgi:hypothetical protein